MVESAVRASVGQETPFDGMSLRRDADCQMLYWIVAAPRAMGACHRVPQAVSLFVPSSTDPDAGVSRCRRRGGGAGRRVCNALTQRRAQATTRAIAPVGTDRARHWGRWRMHAAVNALGRAWNLARVTLSANSGGRAASPRRPNGHGATCHIFVLNQTIDINQHTMLNTGLD